MLLDNPLNPDPRVEKEAKTLAGAGYEVTVYCQKADGLTDYEKKDGYTIRRTFRYKLGTTVKISKYINAHWELWKSIKEKYDVYHCHDVETWPVGYFLAKRDGARLVYDAHEYFPDMIVKGNYRSILKYYASKVLFYLRGSLFIRKANHVITVNNNIPEHWMYDPKDIRYVHGLGLSEKYLKTIIRNVIEQGGIEALQLSDKPELEQLFKAFAYSGGVE